MTTMTNHEALRPGVSILAKLGTAIVHIENILMADGQFADRVALENLLKDKDVRAFMLAMESMALVPRTRNTLKAA